MPRAGAVRCTKKEDNVLSLTVDAAQAADQGAAVTASKITANSDKQLESILTSLSEDKAEDIVQIDLRGQSAIGDYMIICSGRSTRQVTAIAEKLAERLKTELGVTSKIEGKDAGDWVLIDTGDIIIHIFRPEVRDFYQLEKMWVPGASAAAADS